MAAAFLCTGLLCGAGVARADAADTLLPLAAFLDDVQARIDKGDSDGAQGLWAAAADDAASEVVRAHARHALWVRARQAGQPAAADALRRRLGAVEAAALLGPFDNPGGALFDQPLVEERAATFPETGMGLAGPVGWQPVALAGADPAWPVDAHLSARDEVRALLAVVAEADRPTAAHLFVSASGQVAAFVDGHRVLRADGERDLGVDQFVVPVSLHKGSNLIVVRLGNVTGRLQARVRLVAPGEQPLGGVRLSSSLDDIRAAWRPLRDGPGPAPAVAPVDVRAALDEVTAQGPLIAPVQDGADLLSAAITVERAVHTRDGRQRPDALTVWLLAREVRDRVAYKSATGPAAESARGRLVRSLTASGTWLLEGQPSKARPRLEEALALAPGDTEALCGLARLRNRQDQLSEARTLYWQVASAPGATPGQRVESLSALRFLDEHRTKVERAILDAADKTPHPQLLELAASVWLERDHLLAARAYIERIRAVDATHLGVLRFLRRWAESAPDDPGAIDAYRTALRARVDLVPHDWSRVDQLVRLSAHGPAPVDLTPWAQRYPQRAEPADLCATAALLRGDSATADDCLRRALALAPQDADLAELVRRRGAKSLDLVALTEIPLAAQLAAPVPAGASDEGAYALGRHIAVDVAPNGLSTTVERIAYRVLDEKKAAWLREVAVGYTEGREQVTVLLAERVDARGQRHPPRQQYVRTPDGKVDGMYTDAASLVIDFGALAAGDVLHVVVETRSVGAQNLFGDFFGGLWAAAHRIPMQSWTISLLEPAGRPVQLGGRGVPDPAVQQLDGRRLHQVTLRDVPALPLEPLMDPPLSDIAYVAASTRAAWQDLASWYADFVRPQLVLNDELRAVARAAVQGAATDEEKARRLYKLVVGQTRYVGIELGIHGWKPYPVTEVWRRRYGDCKDKSSLLVSLLHEVGVPAELGLVRTADRGQLEPHPASMWAFNHAITYLPGLDHYVDPTAEYMSFDELPALDQGAQVLRVDPFGQSPRSATLAQVPLAPANKNLNQSRYDIAVNDAGDIALRGTERFSGVPAAEQRARLVDVGRREKRVADDIGSALPGAVVDQFSVTDVSLEAAVVGYDFSGRVPGFATRAGPGLSLPVSIYPQDLVQGYASLDARERALFIQSPWRTTNRMRFRVPAGHRVAALPDSVTIDGEHFFFEQRIEVVEDGFEVRETCEIKHRRIPAADYAQFRHELEQADRRMRARVLLTPAGAT